MTPITRQMALPFAPNAWVAHRGHLRQRKGPHVVNGESEHTAGRTGTFRSFGGVSAIAGAIWVLAACRPLDDVGQRRALITGSVGDPAPALVVPASGSQMQWRPAETRAGELTELLEAIDVERRLHVVSELVDATRLAARFAEATGVQASALEGTRERLSVSPSERTARLAELAGGGGLALVLDAPAADAESGESRAAHIYGGCDSVRTRLGRAQEFGLMRLETFLDRADALLASVHAQALRREGERLRRLARSESGATCSAAVAAHARALLACAETEAPCAWTPRIFLQGYARVGRLAEPPDLALSSAGCSHELASVLSRSDAAVADALPGLARAWSELAARVATLGELDAAIREGCAPRRRRVGSEALEGLDARLRSIESMLAEGAGEEDARGWLEAVHDGARWRAGEGSFHVPGLGRVVEVARFDGGPAAASTQVREAAAQLRAAILAAGECLGRPGEAPARWSVIDLDDQRLLASGEVFVETLVCGDMPLMP